MAANRKPKPLAEYKSMTCNQIYLITILVFSFLNAGASSFKGHNKASTAQTLTYTESVRRFIENKNQFLIAISNHAAFYEFPKNPEHSSQFRDFLNSRIKTKKKLVFEVDPETAKIFIVRDTEK